MQTRVSGDAVNYDRYVIVAARKVAIHILKLILIQKQLNPCIREICGKSAFHGAHSDAMCLSEVNAEILVKTGEYLDSSLRDKIMSCSRLIAKSMTCGRISPF